MGLCHDNIIEHLRRDCIEINMQAGDEERKRLKVYMAWGRQNFTWKKFYCVYNSLDEFRIFEIRINSVR